MLTATAHVQAGLALAEEFSLSLAYQYLYSTQGEIVLAEGHLDEAEGGVQRALAEAEKHGNQTQAASVRANLGLVASVRGDHGGALRLL